MLHRTAVLTALATAALALPASAGAAEIMYATTPGNALISFTAQAPSALRSSEPIGGLNTGETIIGMDQRPATGQLYALTSTGRVLVVERSSGDTREITPTPLTLIGTQFGFDFNPVVDRIRIVSDQEQDLRVNPDTGLLGTTDGNLAYAVGDANAGKNPSVGAAAYTNGSFGNAPASTTLFDLNSTQDTFVRQDPPNDGTLVTVGALGVDAVEPTSLAIGRDNKQYAAFATNGSASMQLWNIAATGAATPAATVATLPATTVTSLTTVGETADDASAPYVAVGNYTTYRGIWTARGLRFTVTCLTECSTKVTLRIGSTIAGTATVETKGSGTRAPKITLTSAGRNLANKTGRYAASLTFENTDAAGNTRTQTAKFTSLPGTNALGG